MEQGVWRGYEGGKIGVKELQEGQRTKAEIEEKEKL